MKDLAPIIIVPAFFYAIYAIFELFVRRQERMAIIEKLADGVNLSVLRNKVDLLNSNESTSWALRIGCLLLGIGMGIVIVCVVELCLGITDRWNSPTHTMYPAAAALFGGLGLIIAYVMERKHKKNDKE